MVGLQNHEIFKKASWTIDLKKTVIFFVFTQNCFDSELGNYFKLLKVSIVFKQWQRSLLHENCSNDLNAEISQLPQSFGQLCKPVYSDAATLPLSFWLLCQSLALPQKKQEKTQLTAQSDSQTSSVLFAMLMLFTVWKAPMRSEVTRC